MLRTGEQPWRKKLNKVWLTSVMFQGRNIVLTTQFVEPQVDKVQEGIISLLPQIDLLVTWSTIGGVAVNGIRSGQ